MAVAWFNIKNKPIKYLIGIEGCGESQLVTMNPHEVKILICDGVTDQF
jgi:hypothetical protein